MQMTLKHFSHCLFYFCSTCADCLIELILITIDTGCDYEGVFVTLHSNPIAGESALDRLACGLGGKTMLPHITNSIPHMLQNGSLLLCLF